tara:strand:- start:823 stop:933 length:111 start_codon:yes stop_codon:yes gene_type:complete
MREEVLKVLTYLSWLNAVNDTENKFNELISKKQKLK